MHYLPESVVSRGFIPAAAVLLRRTDFQEGSLGPEICVVKESREHQRRKSSDWSEVKEIQILMIGEQFYRLDGDNVEELMHVLFD